MPYKVVMIRTDKIHDMVVQKEYTTQIPIQVIARLSLIEKRDWPLFRDSSYNMFGEFIYHNLSQYKELIPYITKSNCRFEFIYEYITDSSPLIHTHYYYQDIEITASEYHHYAHQKYYLERWMIMDSDHNRMLVFFECEFIPSHSTQ